jgi:geranylgeranyl diphosphate synthase type I
MTELAERLADFSTMLDDQLRPWLDEWQRGHPMYRMAVYHLGWLDENLRPCPPSTGKRLRPALCFLACEHVGGPTGRALPGAAAVELIHNFSLVHDDIQDASPLRRHRPTVWSLWGVGQGINVGDSLFALAQLALLELGHGASDVDAATRNRAVRTLNRTCLALCEGQSRDLSFQHGAGGLDDYLAMIAGKAGALFGGSAELGALLGGAPDAVIRRLTRFGQVLGEAYQMQDDIDGVWGDCARTGKVPNDVAQRKRGLPAVLGLQRASGVDLQRLRRLYLGQRHMDDTEARWVTGLFDRLGVRAATERLARERVELAEALLRGTRPTGAAPSPLHVLVEAVAGRSG